MIASNKEEVLFMKKKMVKKLISVSLVSVMAVSMLAACGGGSSNSDEGGASSEGDSNVLKVAAFEGGNGAEIWEKITAAFEEETGCEVELTLSSELDQVLTKNIQNGDIPDIVYYNLGQASGFTETMLKEEAVADISDVFDDELKGKMLDGILDGTAAQPYGDGKIYLAPIFYTQTGFWYNANLVGEGKEYAVPTTWDEMFELGQQAKADGRALFTYPQPGYFDATIYAMLAQAGGTEFYNNALTYDANTWTSEEGRKVLDTVAQLVSSDNIWADTVSNANTDGGFKINQQAVIDGEALFMPNGSWVVGEMAEAPRAEGFEWGFTALPAIVEDGERASYTFFEQVWMPKGAENKDLGKEFIAYLYSDEAAEIFASGDSPAVQPIVGMSEKLSGDNKLFYSIYDNGAVAVMDAFATTDPVEGITVRGTFFDPVNSLVTGDKTKDDWVSQIISDSDALRAALKQ